MGVVHRYGCLVIDRRQLPASQRKHCMLSRLSAWCASMAATAILAGCASWPTPDARRRHADTLAFAKGWQPRQIQADVFWLTAYLPQVVERTEALTVYFEGDGFAWISASQPSPDPTPIVPMGLQLALAQPRGAAAYLARPCQFSRADTSECPERYWTHARFAKEVVDASSTAVDGLKQLFGARQLHFVGYSGGAAVAALVAARRNDVVRLVTVAGNLDHQAWTLFHHLEPLSGSLNPADEAARLASLSQWHLSGGQDPVIPPALTQSFARRFQSAPLPVVQVLPDFDHQCCWVRSWPQLWTLSPTGPSVQEQAGPASSGDR